MQKRIGSRSRNQMDRVPVAYVIIIWHLVHTFLSAFFLVSARDTE